jgi:hypothetical protein
MIFCDCAVEQFKAIVAAWMSVFCSCELLRHEIGKKSLICDVKSSAGAKLSVDKNIEELNLPALKPVPRKTASEIISKLISLTQASYQKNLTKAQFLKGTKTTIPTSES